jgi:ketosteroid isomerase-like protein
MTNENVKKIAQQWMENCCQTIHDYDHSAHMNLISEDVQVLGVPGYDAIGYADWYSQCEYEFREKLIAKASFDGLKIRQSDESKIKFLTNETIHTTDGTIENHPLEVVLSREHDGAWRATQERLLNQDEARELGIK